MNINTIAALLVTAILAAATPATCDAQDSALTPEELAARVQAGRLRYQTISVRETMTDTMFCGQPRDNHKTQVVWRRTPGRWYLEFIGWQLQGGQWQRTGSSTYAGDGQVCQALRTRSEPRISEGEVAAPQLTGNDKWGEYLWDPIGHGDTWSGIKNDEAQVGFDAASGLWVLVRRTGNVCHRITVDPAKSWFPVQHTVTYEGVGGREVITFDVTNGDFRQVGNGLWLPHKQTFIAQSRQEGNRTVTVHVLDSVMVNGEIPESEMGFTFPFGTKVTDRFSDTFYYAHVRPAVVAVLSVLLAVLLAVWLHQRSARRTGLRRWTA